MSTHEAVVVVGKKVPLETRQVPTVEPGENEIRIKNLWVASTPLDLHIADGGLVVGEYPRLIGSGYSGVVVDTHPSVTSFKVGDKVFGFGLGSESTQGHQTSVTVPAHFAGKLPEGFSLQQAATTTGSVVTVFQAMTHDLGLELPWPVPEGYVPTHADEPILVWGGSGSVGLFALQILRHWGYKRIFATASKRNHDLLRESGATELFDYREPDVVDKINAAAGPRGIRYVLDCIGHLGGSVKPVTKIAKNGTHVAIVLPIIVRDSGEGVEPVYEMDANAGLQWAEGVKPSGIRAHFYDNNPAIREKAQPEMVPELMKSGAIKPLPYRIVEGQTLLERAEKALSILRGKETSAARLVWQVAEN